MASDILSYRDQKGVHVIDTVYDCAGQVGVWGIGFFWGNLGGVLGIDG